MHAMNTDQCLQIALAHHRAGEYVQAEEGYKDLLEVEPGHPVANHNLGVLRIGSGDASGSLPYFIAALNAVPAQGQYWLSYIDALIQAGQQDEARKMLVLARQHGLQGDQVGELAIRLNHAVPGAGDQDANVNLDVLLHESRRSDEAECGQCDALQIIPQNAKAHDINPDYAEELCIQGFILLGKNKLEEAEASLRRALQLKPDFPEAYTNLGNVLKEMERMDEAEASYRRAIELNPHYSAAYNNLGVILNHMGRLEEAQTSLRRALQLDPDSASAHCNLGTVLYAMKKRGEAEARYRRAIDIDADSADAHMNLGTILKEMGRFDEAESSYREAIRLKPDYSDAYLNLGLLFLSLGRYAEGWLFYEFRIDPRRKVIRHPDPSISRWKGESLAGKTLVLYPEQGNGDYIQFIRYAPMLKARGVFRLIVVCYPTLKPLLETMSGVDEIKTRFMPDESHDYWVLPMSLPLYLGTTLETIPVNIPYLHALPERISKWRLSAEGLKVGLVWKGNKEHGNDQNRSLPELPVLAPLWKVAGVTFYSLQKGQGEDEAKSPPADQPLIHLGSDVEDFADTAAIIAQLDLVICVDTSVAHLAGAMGKPCWVMLPCIDTDWRWLRDREDSPWYPSMRLFRQKESGKWDNVVQHLCLALREVSRKGLGDAGRAIEELMQSAIELHRSGAFSEAESDYREALKANPDHPVANHNLGLLLVQSDRAMDALSYFASALNADPAQGQYWLSYIDALIQAGQQDEARQIVELAQQHGLQGDQVESLASRLNLNISGPSNQEMDALVELFVQGQFDFAAAEAKRLTEKFPDQGFGWKGLGVAYKELGRNEEALEPMKRAVALFPSDVEAQYNLGVVLQALGRMDEAESSYRKSLGIDPDYVDAHVNLGVLLHGYKHFEEAERSLRRALEIMPQNAKAIFNLGNVLLELDKFDEAEQIFKSALSLPGGEGEAYFGLGRALKEQGYLDQAEAAYRQSLQFNPDNANVHYNLGNLLVHQGRMNEAEISYQQALSAKPDFAETYNNLALMLNESGRLKEAEQACLAALSINPDLQEARSSLGLIYKNMGRLDESMASYLYALDLKSDDMAALNNLGNVFKDTGDLDQAIDCYRRAADLDLQDISSHCNLVYSIYFHPGYDETRIKSEAERFAKLHRLSATMPHKDHDRTSQRRLRIGYVSPNFRSHCQSLFTIPLLSHHDHSNFEIFCYAQLLHPDELTSRIQGHADVWRDTNGLDDEKLAKMITADGIDILIDLTMHMDKGKPMLFARRPAPVQISWLAYPGTTGIPEIDYRLTDPWLDPVELGDERYVEKSLRLPHTFWCYDPLTSGLQPNPLPALSKNHVTFGCLNNFCKVTDDTLELWAGVMSAVAGSRLLLLSPLGSHRQRVLDMLKGYSISPDRVEFVEPMTRRNYLETYHRIDICLDTLPYNGHTTSLDAYWMGVPVVTRIGSTVVGRAGWSQLNNLGLTELAACDEQSFVKIAVELSADLPKLVHLRQTLRHRMESSPLMDGAGFASAMESIYRKVWQDWCV